MKNLFHKNAEFVYNVKDDDDDCSKTRVCEEKLFLERGGERGGKNKSRIRQKPYKV